MQLNPMHLKVATLLQSRLFRIPEYQRAYSWGSRQRTDLFNDILEAHRSSREHFMATVVALARDSRTIGADEYRTVQSVRRPQAASRHALAQDPPQRRQHAHRLCRRMARAATALWLPAQVYHPRDQLKYVGVQRRPHVREHQMGTMVPNPDRQPYLTQDSSGNLILGLRYLTTGSRGLASRIT